MSDGYLDSIIQVVATYQASYLPTPIADLPGSGCVLPSLTALPSALGSPAPPGTLKNCVPPFTPFPIIPAPYSIPENCPNGITFESTEVGIYAQASDSEPTAVITVGASQNSNFCSYSLDIPDIVIPCFPAGPQFNGSATVTVSDPNAGTVKIGSISVAKSTEVACDWTLQGNIDITLPTVPCQSGITFQNTSLPIYNQSGTLMASPLVGIVSSGGNPCLFEIEMPDLVIPCYPGGPSISGGVTVQTTDSANNSTTSTQSLSFASSILNPCSFTLTGPDLVVDVPCASTGTSITFAPLTIHDPTNSTTTTLTIPASTKVDGNPCQLNVVLPTIDIPCSSTGIGIAGTTTILVGNQTIGSGIPSQETGYTNIGQVNGCTWAVVNPTIQLPTLYCEGGAFDYGSNLQVKVNGQLVSSSVSANNSYNTTELTAPEEGCGVSLGGVINLQIPCPGGISTSGSTSSINLVNSNNEVSGSIGLSFENCQIGFTNPSTTISGLLPCNNPVAPTSTVVFKNSDGSVNSSSTLTLGGSLCSLGLNGTIQFPGASGSGIQEWNPFGAGAGFVYSASTEGGLDLYIPTPGASPGPNDWPGASSKWTHVSGTSLTPFQVIKSNTPIPATTVNSVDAGLIATQTDCVVKVNPVSYLYSSSTNNTDDPSSNRLPIFGLDMPFLLKPGEMVYLEVVHAYLGNSTTPTPLYGAICKGTAYDTDIGANKSGIYIATGGAATPNQLFKLITQQTLTSAGYVYTAKYNNLADYIFVSLSNYVGLYQDPTLGEGLTGDLFAIQEWALNTIYTQSQTTGTVSTPWQFKTYEVIAYAETNSSAALPSGNNPAIPRKTGGVQLSYNNGSTTQYYTVKQQIHSHQALRSASTGSSANIPVLVLGNTSGVRGIFPFLQDANNNYIQPQYEGLFSTTAGATISTSVASFDIGNAVYAKSSVLLERLYNLLQPNVSMPNILAKASTLSVGNGLLDIKVYVTHDGSIPTINTLINAGCTRYEGTAYEFENTIAAPPNRITWMGVYPEFSIVNPATVTANYTDPTNVTWGNEVNG